MGKRERDKKTGRFVKGRGIRSDVGGFVKDVRKEVKQVRAHRKAERQAKKKRRG